MNAIQEIEIHRPDWIREHRDSNTQQRDQGERESERPRQTDTSRETQQAVADRANASDSRGIDRAEDGGEPVLGKVSLGKVRGVCCCVRVCVSVVGACSSCDI